MAYNPYSDLRKIYNYKTEYNKAKSANDTAAMKNAQDSAALFYQNLRDNGYSNYADQMSGFTEEQAKDWIDNFESITPNVQVNAGAFEPMQSAAPAKASGSIYNNITPDVYKWVQGVTDNKTLYDNSKYTLQDGNFQQYADLAIPYYESLREAGRSDIADYLSGSSTPQALEYLRSIGIELEPVQQDMNSAFMNLLTQPSQSADYGTLWQQSQPIVDYISQAAQPDAMTQAANQQAVNNMNALMGQILGNNQQIQQDSASLNELIKQYMGEQTARYDDLYDYLKNTNYYDTDTAKNIMSYYNAMGGKAANEATAEGMAQNSGNIDSYAAANALRQQLDFTNAGNAAVLNQYNAQTGKMLDTLRALGVDVGDAQDRLAGILGGNQAYNAELLGGYNTGSNIALGAVNGANDTRVNATADMLGKLLDSWSSGDLYSTNRYLGQLDAAKSIINNRDTQQAKIDSAKVTAEAEKEKAYNDMVAKIQEAMIEADSDESISAEETNQKMQQAILEYQAKIYAADAEANAKLTDSYNSLEGTKYSADKNAEADKYVADKNAEADKYAVDNKESTAKTEPETIGYDALLYTFSNLRPEIAAESTALTEEQIDEATWRAIGKELGWTESEAKRYIEWYRSIADDSTMFIGPAEQPTK